MTDSMIARRYAAALFALGREQGEAALSRYNTDLQALCEQAQAVPALAAVLKSPIIATAEKKAVLSAVLKKMKIDQTVRNFCLLLADKERLACLGDIVRCYGTLLDEARGILRGRLTTAVELTEERQVALKAELEQKAGTSIELGFDVDPDILGGIVLKVGDKVLDASLRAQLAILRETFKRGE